MPPADPSIVAAPPDAAYRLPRNVEPHTYRIELTPDLDAALFEGVVEIDLTVHEASNQLVCNAVELGIEEATLVVDQKSYPAVVALDDGTERATFTFSESLPLGPATFRCRFTGILNDKLRGFYRSTFTGDDGTTRVMATSQMEATEARRAFPCWDEPDLKAVFEITLIVDAELAAYSNSSVQEVVDLGDGRKRVRFSPTIKMSTYLVAFVVGPLVATEAVDVEGVPLRVVHVPGKEHLTEFALEVAIHALRFFTDYFDIAYPGEKLDLLAIPDFAFGAMENLGCVTFREAVLLVDPARAARVDLERVADVVCHEIAHMWFGDLVTMRWWEGIWLNEAFATFMEVLCVDAFRPAWERWVSFGVERETALAIDGLHSTRPIEYPVGSPSEADGMFDALTYLKGGGVLRMLEQYIGPEAFREGVRRYLAAHAYANTVTADLWDALEAASGAPVRSVMDTWILQGGHPVITVGETSLTQQPFAYGPPSPDLASAIGQSWEVPVALRTLDRAAAPSPPALLLLRSDSIDLPVDQAGDAVVVANAGGSGVFRVAYDADRLEPLSHRLSELTPLEQADLFADTWATVLAGHTPLAGFFTLAARLGHEREPSAWGVLAGALGLCDRSVAEGERSQLAAATRALLGPRAAELGWEKQPGESDRTPTLRALMVGTLGTIGEDPAIQAEAERRFDTDRSGDAGSALDADLAAAVLSVVAHLHRPGDFESFVERFSHPADPQEEVRYLYALAAFPDVDLAQRAYDMALDGVRTQDAPYLVASLLSNRVAGPVIWERVKADWETLIERFPENSHSRMLSAVRALSGDPAVAEDVISFLRAHPVRSGQRTVLQALERLGVNVAFAQRQRSGLGALLAEVAGDPRP